MNTFLKLVVFAIINIIALQHAVGQEYIRFENRWMRTHQIHNQTGPVTSGETKPGWYSAQWLTEPVTESDGVTYYRLKNRWKGAYLHTQSGVLELGPVEPDWTSAMWAFEKSGTPGFYRVQNRESKKYLHIQTGSLDLGTIQPNWISAHWKLLGYTGNGSTTAPNAPASVAQGTATLTEQADSIGANALSNFKPYYHTLDTKSCELGSAGYTWTYHTRSGVSLISAMGNRLTEYFLPTTPGITGRYHYWGHYGTGDEAKGFIGAEGFNWTADFNRTGQSQLASANGALIFVREPGFSANGVEYEVAGAWGAPGYTWAADFTGDGRADIASASGNKVTMRIKTQSRERKEGFRLETWNVAGSWGDAAYTFVGDFNNDGKADIASGYGSTMYMSISTGAAFTNEAWQAPVAWGAAGYAWVGDFDGDGFVDDIAAANGGSVSIAFSNGKGFDVRNGRIPNQWGQAGYAWAADFDRDGKTDIASANNCSVAYMRSDGLNFRLQNWKLELPRSPRCSSVLADLNSVQQYEINGLDGASKAAEGGSSCDY